MIHEFGQKTFSEKEVSHVKIGRRDMRAEKAESAKDIALAKFPYRAMVIGQEDAIASFLFPTQEAAYAFARKIEKPRHILTARPLRRLIK